MTKPPVKYITQGQAVLLQELGMDLGDDGRWLALTGESMGRQPSVSEALDWCRMQRPLWAIVVQEDKRVQGKWHYRGWLVNENYKVFGTESTAGYKNTESVLLNFILERMKNEV